MIGNRDALPRIAEQFGVDFHNIGDEKGTPDNSQLERLCDEYDVDYIILARYSECFLRAPAGSLLADESSTCITGCCLRFPVSARITMPTAGTC